MYCQYLVELIFAIHYIFIYVSCFLHFYRIITIKCQNIPIFIFSLLHYMKCVLSDNCIVGNVCGFQLMTIWTSS